MRDFLWSDTEGFVANGIAKTTSRFVPKTRATPGNPTGEVALDDTFRLTTKEQRGRGLEQAMSATRPGATKPMCDEGNLILERRDTTFGIVDKVLKAVRHLYIATSVFVHVASLKEKQAVLQRLSGSWFDQGRDDFVKTIEPRITVEPFLP